jgi:hypothetical protein
MARLTHVLGLLNLKKIAYLEGIGGLVLIMKAIRLYASGGPETLVFEDAPKPQPKEGEVLIRAPATAITPAEFAWEPNWRALSGEARPFTLILGHEFQESSLSLGQMGCFMKALFFPIVTVAFFLTGCFTVDLPLSSAQRYQVPYYQLDHNLSDSRFGPSPG